MELLFAISGKGLMCVGLLSGMPLLISCLTGLFIAVLQAASSVQEQSSLYVVKLVSVSLVFLFGGRFLSALIESLFTDVFRSLIYFGALS